ncbi:MAG: RNA polymerase sigma factor [Nocardioides sp.]
MTVEADLVERARLGDPQAWGELYESLTGRLLVWLRTRPSGDSAVSAEDLVAETWLVAAQRIVHFTGTRDDFAGWIFGIARNLAVNARRRSLRRRTDPQSVADERQWGISETPAVEVDGIDWVRRTLATLPPREGEVLACTEVVGLDVATTATLLGVSGAAVRVARHRGLGKLRRAAVPATMLPLETA